MWSDEEGFCAKASRNNEQRFSAPNEGIRREFPDVHMIYRHVLLAAAVAGVGDGANETRPTRALSHFAKDHLANVQMR